MTASAKVKVLLAALTCLSLAIFGAKELLGVLYDPILRSLGA